MKTERKIEFKLGNKFTIKPNQNNNFIDASFNADNSATIQDTSHKIKHKFLKVILAVFIVMMLSVTSAFASEYFVTSTNTINVQIEKDEHYFLQAPPTVPGEYKYTWSYCSGVFEDILAGQTAAYVNLETNETVYLEVDASMIQQYQISPNLAKFRCLVSDRRGNVIAEQVYKVSVKTDAISAIVSAITKPSQTSTTDVTEKVAVSNINMPTSNANADMVEIRVQYQDTTGRSLGQDTITTVEKGKNFNWSVQLKDTLGELVKAEHSSELNAEADDHGYLAIWPENVTKGIDTDQQVIAKYKPSTSVSYTINAKLQKPDSSYYIDETFTDGTGEAGHQFPTSVDLEKIKKRIGEKYPNTYHLIKYNTATITQDGSASTDVIFDLNIVSISFKPNEGINGPDTIYGRIGQEVPKSSITPPGRAGYTFAGWREDKEGSQTGDLPDTFPTISTTYVAEWTPPREGDGKQVHIVYWGEKAERNETATFSPQDFDYLGECTVDGIPYHENPEEKYSPMNDYLLPHDPSGNIMTDYPKYWVTNPIYKKDDPVWVQPDNLTIYNVYYSRLQYTMTFQWDKDWYGRQERTIKAKWDQDIYKQFTDITEERFGTGVTSGPWFVKRTYKDWFNYVDTYVNLFTNMHAYNYTYKDKYHDEDYASQIAQSNNNENINQNQENAEQNSNNQFDQEENKSSKFHYYLQEPYADYEKAKDLYKSPGKAEKQLEGLFTNPYTALLNTTYTVSEDEFIPIYGFTAPNPDRHYAPEIGDEAKWDYCAFYKRNTWNLGLVSVLGNQKDNPIIDVSDAPFDCPLNKIIIPNDVPGNFIEGQPHTLENFIPDNPNIENIDKNYVFKGWSTTLGGKNPIDLTKYKMPNAGFNLYAIWGPPGDITLNFNEPENPANPEGKIKTTFKLDKQTYNEHPTEKFPTPESSDNYEFVAWYYYKTNSDKDQGIKTYFTQDMLVPGHDINLYAEYAFVGTSKYTVHYVYKNSQQENIAVADDSEGEGITGQEYTIYPKTTKQLYLDYRDLFVPEQDSTKIIAGDTKDVTFTYKRGGDDIKLKYQVRYRILDKEGNPGPVMWSDDIVELTNITMATASADMSSEKAKGYKLHDGEYTKKTVLLNKEELNYIDFYVDGEEITLTYQVDNPDYGYLLERILSSDEPVNGAETQLEEKVNRAAGAPMGCFAVPNHGYKLDKWVYLDKDGKEHDVNPDEIIGNALVPIKPSGSTYFENRTYVAKFKVADYSIAFAPYPDGSGTVKSLVGGDIKTLPYGTKYKIEESTNAFGDIISFYKDGSKDPVVKYQATPATGKSFNGWYLSYGDHSAKPIAEEGGILDGNSEFYAAFEMQTNTINFETDPKDAKKFEIENGNEIKAYFGATVNTTTGTPNQLTIKYTPVPKDDNINVSNEEVNVIAKTTDAAKDYEFVKWVAIENGKELKELPTTIVTDIKFVAKFAKRTCVVDFIQDENYEYNPDTTQLSFEAGTSVAASISEDKKTANINFTAPKLNDETAVSSSLLNEIYQFNGWEFSKDEGKTWNAFTSLTLSCAIKVKPAYSTYTSTLNIDINDKDSDPGKIEKSKDEIIIASDMTVASDSTYNLIDVKDNSKLKVSLINIKGEKIEDILTAKAYDGHKFKYWATEDDEGNLTPIAESTDLIKILDNTKLRAVFDLSTVTISFASIDPTKGTVDPTSYSEALLNTEWKVVDNKIQIKKGNDFETICTAKANTGYKFVDWKYNDSKEAATTGSLRVNDKFTANFEQEKYTVSFGTPSKYNLFPKNPSFEKVPSFTSPTVVVKDATETETAEYSINFTKKEENKVTATPDNNYKFLYWYTKDEKGNEVKITNDYIITSDIEVFAKVEGMGLNLFFNVDNDSKDMGTVDRDKLGVANLGANYTIDDKKGTVTIDDNGAITTINAKANDGFKFKNWTVIEITPPKSSEENKGGTDITNNLQFSAHFESYDVNVKFEAEGAKIDKDEYNFIANTTFDVAGSESNPKATVTFADKDSTVVTATANEGNFFRGWQISYDGEKFEPIKAEDKTLTKDCTIKAKFSTNTYEGKVVSANEKMGSIDPAPENPFDIVSGTKITADKDKITFTNGKSYTAKANNLYEFDFWSYRINGGIENPFPAEGITVNSNIEIRANFKNGSARYSFYFDDDYSNIEIADKTPFNTLENFIDEYDYNDENKMSNKNKDFLSNSTFTFTNESITVTNSQDSTKKFTVKASLKQLQTGYDFIGWYLCDDKGNPQGDALSGTQILTGDDKSNKIVAQYNNSGVPVHFIVPQGCTIEPAAKQITASTGSFVKYDQKEQKLSFTTSDGKDYGVTAKAEGGYSIDKWVETNSSGSASIDIPKDGLKISSEKWFKVLVDNQSFDINFETSPDNAGSIDWDGYETIAGDTDITVGLSENILKFTLPDKSATFISTATKSTGYKFEKWQIKIGSANYVDFDKNKHKKITADTSFKALFKTDTVKLNLSVFNPKGGTIGDCGPGDFDIPRNSSISYDGISGSLKFKALNDKGLYEDKNASVICNKDWSLDKWEYSRDGKSWDEVTGDIENIVNGINMRLTFRNETDYTLEFSAVNGFVSTKLHTVTGDQHAIKAKREKIVLDAEEEEIVIAHNDGGSSRWNEWEYKDTDGTWKSLKDGSSIPVKSNMEIKAVYTLDTLKISFSEEPIGSGNLNADELQIKQGSVISLDKDEQENNYINFTYLEEDPVSNYFTTFGDYGFSEWQYQEPGSLTWKKVTEGMQVNNNNTKFRAVAFKSKFKINLYKKDGGNISPDSNAFSVETDATYQYIAELNKIIFTNVSGEESTKEFTGVADEMYAFDTWNTVTVSGQQTTYTPIPDGDKHPITEAMNFGVTFNPKLSFSSSDTTKGDIQYTSSKGQKIDPDNIIVKMDTAITYNNSSIKFNTINNDTITVTAEGKNGYKFSKWTASSSTGTLPDVVKEGYKFEAQFDVFDATVTFDNQSISDMGKVDPASLTVKTTTKVTYDDSKLNILNFAYGTTKQTATCTEFEGNIVNGWEFSTDGGKKYSPLESEYQIMGKSIIIRPTFKTDGDVKVTFMTSSKEGGSPSVDSTTSVNNSYYEYNAEKGILTFVDPTSGETTIKISAKANTGYEFDSWALYDTKSKKQTPIPEDASKRQIKTGICFIVNFKLLTCNLTFDREEGGSITIDPQFKTVTGLTTVVPDVKSKLLTFTSKDGKATNKATAKEQPGYTFNKWQYSEDEGKSWNDFPEATKPAYSVTTTSLHIKAVFDKSGFTASFKEDPEKTGDISDTSISPIDVDSVYTLSKDDDTVLNFSLLEADGSTTTKQVTATEIKDNGYKFDAWYVNLKGVSKKVADLTDDERKVSGNLSFIAKFISYECIITPSEIAEGGKYVNSDGGSPTPKVDPIDVDSITNITIGQASGTKYSSMLKFSNGDKTIDKSLYTKEDAGFSFNRWEISEDEGKTWTELTNNYHVLKEDVYIRPTFINVGVKITFSISDGDCTKVDFPTGFIATTNSTYKYEEPTTNSNEELYIVNHKEEKLELITHRIQTPGFEYVGWNIKTGAGKSKPIPEKTEDRVLTEDTEFELQVKRKTYNLTFDVSSECEGMGSVGPEAVTEIDSSNYLKLTLDIEQNNCGKIEIFNSEGKPVKTIMAEPYDGNHCIGCTMYDGSAGGQVVPMAVDKKYQVLADYKFNFFFAVSSVSIDFTLPQDSHGNMGRYTLDEVKDGFKAKVMTDKFVNWSYPTNTNKAPYEAATLNFYYDDETITKPYISVWAQPNPGYSIVGWEYKFEGEKDYAPVPQTKTSISGSKRNVSVRPVFETFKTTLKFKSNNTDKGNVDQSELDNIQTKTPYTVNTEETTSKITIHDKTIGDRTITAKAESGYHFDHWGVRVEGDKEEHVYNPNVDKDILDNTEFTAYFTTFPIKITAAIDPAIEGAHTTGGYFDIQETPTKTEITAQSKDKIYSSTSEDETSSVLKLISDVPQELKTVAYPGYKFKGWEYVSGGERKPIPETKDDAIELDNDTQVYAEFVPFDAKVDAKVAEGKGAEGDVVVEPKSSTTVKTLTTYSYTTKTDDKQSTSTITFGATDNDTADITSITATANFDEGYKFKTWIVKTGGTETPIEEVTDKTILDDTEFIACFELHPVKVEFVIADEYKEKGAFVDETGKEIDVEPKQIYTRTEFEGSYGIDTNNSKLIFDNEARDTVYVFAQPGYHITGWTLNGDPLEDNKGMIKMPSTISPIFSTFDTTLEFGCGKNKFGEDYATFTEGGNPIKEEYSIETTSEWEWAANAQDPTKATFNFTSKDGEPHIIDVQAVRGYHFKEFDIVNPSQTSNDDPDPKTGSGKFVDKTRASAVCVPFQVSINVYGVNAKPISSARIANEDSPIWKTDVWTMSDYSVAGVIDELSSSLTYKNMSNIKLTQEFINDGYYAFKQWQVQDEDGNWVPITSSDDITIYNNVNLKVVYGTYNCYLNFETNTIPGRIDKLGEIKGYEGSEIPEYVQSTTKYKAETIQDKEGVDHYVITFTEPETNKVYKVEAIPCAGFRFDKWTGIEEAGEIDIKGPTTINAYFSPRDDTPYTVNWYIRNAQDDVKNQWPPEDPSSLEPDRTIGYTGTTLSKADEYIKDVESYDADGIIRPTSFETPLIQGDGSTVINVFFDRKVVNLVVSHSFDDSLFKKFTPTQSIEPHLYGYTGYVHALGTWVTNSNEYDDDYIFNYMYPDHTMQKVTMGFQASTKIYFNYYEKSYHIDYTMSSDTKGTIEPKFEECKVLSEQLTGATLTPAAGETFLYWQDTKGNNLGSNLTIVPRNPYYDKYHQNDSDKLDGLTSTVSSQVNSTAFNANADYLNDDEKIVCYEKEPIRAVFQSDLPVPPSPDPSNGGADQWAALTGDNLPVFAIVAVLVVSAGVVVTYLVVRKRKSDKNNNHASTKNIGRHQK